MINRTKPSTALPKPRTPYETLNIPSAVARGCTLNPQPDFREYPIESSCRSPRRSGAACCPSCHGRGGRHPVQRVARGGRRCPGPGCTFRFDFGACGLDSRPRTSSQQGFRQLGPVNYGTACSTSKCKKCLTWYSGQLQAPIVRGLALAHCKQGSRHKRPLILL